MLLLFVLAVPATHAQSVYHVCWMRGLFPEEAFTGHDLAQLDRELLNGVLDRVVVRMVGRLRCADLLRGGGKAPCFSA